MKTLALLSLVAASVLQPACQRSSRLDEGDPDGSTDADSDSDSDVDSDTDTNTATDTDTTSDMDLEQGLVAYYPFSGNADDESGNENHGAVVGAQLCADRFDNPQSAYCFTGVDYIDCGDDDTLDITGELSISAWINPSSFTNNNQGIVSKFSALDPANQRSYLLHVDNLARCPDSIPGHRPSMTVSADGNCTAELSDTCTNGCGDTSLSTDHWYHLVGVYVPGNSITVYVDGVLNGANDNSNVESINNGTAPLVIGYQNDATAYPETHFLGAIDDVRI